jgi:hypothetical protein
MSCYDRDSFIDYDLCACLEYNVQPGFNADDIEKVLAVWEGQNDGDDWRWVLQLKDGRFVFLQGGCDYTGWDCQSWATSVFAETPEDAAKFALGDFETVEGQFPTNAGLGHMLNILSGSYANNFNEVYQSLLVQLTEGKTKTWREQKDEEFGINQDT